MLDTLFLSVLDMTKVGSLVILAVMGARLLLRRVPKAVTYALWIVVLLRLLCPVGVQSPVSLLPELQPTAQEYNLEDQPISFSGAGMAAYQAVGDVLNGGIDVQRVATDLKDSQGNIIYVPADMGDVWLLFGSYVWAAGVFALALYSGISFLRLKRKLREAVPQEAGVFLAGGIDSPFVMGRKIYLPEGLADRERAYILAHERHHIRRMDPVWKALGFLALCIHWFNPLVWAAFILACRDMEMSCDEAVVKSFGPEIRGAYAASLLKIATGKRIIAGAPLAFGEGDPKGRIRNLAKWKKPILIVTAVAVVLCLVLAVCLLTDPVKETKVGSNLHFGVLKALEQDAQRTLVLERVDGTVMTFRIAQDYQLPPEIQVGDYVMVRQMVERETEELIANRVAVTESSISASLDEAIEAAILQMNGNGRYPDSFECASFATISTERNGIASVIPNQEMRPETVRVYGIALHQTYTYKDGALEEQSGSHIPVAITFRVTDGGQYVLEEYWMPRDGSYYASDIRQKFQVLQVPDTQEYIESQQAECLAKARAHFGIKEYPVLPPENIPAGTDGITAFELSRVPENESIPLEDISASYDREAAIRDGAVILEYGFARENTEIWDRFAEQVEKKIPARVRTVIINKEKVSFVRDILYDGNLFQAQTGLLEDGGFAMILRKNYAYLQTFRGSRGTEKFVTCVLTNQKQETPPQWLNTAYPSNEGDQLVYQVVLENN